MITYTVKKGDTLSSIASRYNTTANAIKNANKTLIKDVNKIQIGWVLTIPKGSDTSEKYSEIGKAFEKCIEDIKYLDSYQKLIRLIGE